MVRLSTKKELESNIQPGKVRYAQGVGYRVWGVGKRQA